MTKHTRAVAATGLAAIAVAAAIPALPALPGAQASSGKTQILRIFDKPVATTLTSSNGKVTTHPQPKPGDILDVYSLDYVGNHLHHAAHWTMSSHLRCTFGTGQPDCQSHVAVGGSLLIFNGNKLVGGTGLYQGATGRILSMKQVPGGANASDVIARIHRR
jgi:hypothetical protein